MIYAEFQTNSTGWNGKDFSGPVTNVPLLGSDGVYICDGRMSLANQIEAAKKRAKAIQHLHGPITGLIMHRGESFTNSKPITDFIPIDTSK